MKKYEITYDDGYNYSYFRTYAKNKKEARKNFKEAMGKRYRIIEIEEI
ncbi:MAG: hypothetical protein IKU40_02825 [Clostridia bacterium]|nr:hypothetical protein [Clostridia bacterium]